MFPFSVTINDNLQQATFYGYKEKRRKESKYKRTSTNKNTILRTADEEIRRPAEEKALSSLKKECGQLYRRKARMKRHKTKYISHLSLYLSIHLSHHLLGGSDGIGCISNSICPPPPTILVFLIFSASLEI